MKIIKGLFIIVISIVIMLTFPFADLESSNASAKSGDNYPKSVKVSAGSLSPKYGKAKKQYTVTLSANQASTRITVTPANKKASLRIRGKKYYKPGKPIATNVSVARGKSKKVYIQVKSQSGKIRTIAFTVKRKALARYKIDPGKLTSSGLITSARSQAVAGDRSPLASPAPFRILFIGYTNVSYKKKTYKMTAAQKAYLKKVAANFESLVENASGKNVNIIYTVKFVDRKVSIAGADEYGYVYIRPEYIAGDLADLDAKNKYDSTLTTSAMPVSVTKALGLEISGVDSSIGYSTFNIGKPVNIRDKTKPTTYITLVAIHEWLHQLEGYGKLLDIDFPDVHAAQGPNGDPSYPDYPAYTPDTIGDWWYFYRDILGGKVLYKGKDYIGMYPKMWLVTPRSLDAYRFSIRNVQSGKYLAVSKNSVTQSASWDAVGSQWRLLNFGGYVRALPLDSPGTCLDVSNAWATIGNSVNVAACRPSSEVYFDGQMWHVIDNKDGTVSLRTKLDESLALDGSGQGLTLQRAGGGAGQKWVIEGIREEN